ncbi:MAG: recombinase family protein, partial [Candidatus Methanomethylophilaceae archaeon]|nr:recombinase family protein [Candidatus Methanomethylophilaceae archaeon]
MRAALYARVSTEDQAVEGFSLEAQVKKLEAYCRQEGFDVVDRFVDDGYSGRKTNRPEYQRMLKEIDNWDVLVVLKMDRIHRNSVNFTQMM